MKPPVNQKLIILGLDPGTASTGFGLIAKNKYNLELIKYGVIKTSADLALADRLWLIHKKLTKLIKKYQPVLAACEELYFSKNAKTAINVGQARGAIILTLKKLNINTISLTPLQIKQAVTGYGRADKKQIQKMVKLILKLKDLPTPDDAADALAAAICLANSANFRINQNKSSTKI